MAIYKITYSRETLCSLQFWWKCSTTLSNQSGSYCHQPRKLIPLTESTWSALKENGLLKRTRGTRGGVKKSSWRSNYPFPITTISFFVGGRFKSSRSKFTCYGLQKTANTNNLIQIALSLSTNEAEHNQQSKHKLHVSNQKKNSRHFYLDLPINERQSFI